MTPEGRGFRVTLILCGVMVAVGLGLIAIGHWLPVYTVPFDQAMVAFQAWCSDSARVDHAAGDRYWALLGWHYAVMNAGVSLTTAALTAGLLAVGLRLSVPTPLPWLRTPARRVTFIAIGIGIMLGSLAGSIYGLSLDLRRSQFPWCADSIGIPVSGITFVMAVITPCLALVGAIIAQGFGQLPTPLFQWDIHRPLWSWSITIAFGATTAAVILCWALTILSADVVAPSFIVTLYLLASTRAALAASKRPVTDNLSVAADQRRLAPDAPPTAAPRA